MNDSFAEYAECCPVSDLPLIRELMSYDALCPQCNQFNRNHLGGLVPKVEPSPLHWSRQIEWPWIIRNANLQGHEIVLDIGGGWSVLKYALAKRCYKAYSIDNDDPSISASLLTTRIMGVRNIEHWNGDARSLPQGIQNVKFDCCVCCSVIEHINGFHLQCVRQAINVLRPGGTFLLTMDVRMNKEVQGDFYVDDAIATSILKELGITKLRNQLKIFGKVGAADVAVVMVKYVKPL